MPTYDALIERYGVLDRAPGQDLQSLVTLVAQICDVPHAAINILSSSQQHQIVTHGFDPSVCAREDSMCAAVMDDSHAVVVPDASQDPRFSTNPFVTGVMGAVRFYASAPITTREGEAIGRLCIFDAAPRDLTSLQHQALTVMAAQVTELLELRYRSQALEDSLRDLTTVRDELRRSNDDLMHFAGQVSHDLRTPLTAILINAELLAGEPAVTAEPEVAQMVQAVNEAGRRMDALIEQMLTFATENGRLRLDKVDLSAVVGSVVRDLAPLVVREGAEVHVGELPLVLGDSDLLYSVVLNLVTNALKFVRPGEKAVVTIVADRLDRHWRVRVTDNGIGVPPARRAAMFELFAREDDATSGHGIGLATARRIIESHGGTIGMESAAGGGTSVWFDLPG